MHMLTSSHLEAYFGGLVELPKEFPRLSQTSWFYGPFFPSGAPDEGPPLEGPPEGLGFLPREAPGWACSGRSTAKPPPPVGLGWLAGFLAAGLLGFRLDFGLILDLVLDLVLDLDLA